MIVAMSKHHPHDDKPEKPALRLTGSMGEDDPPDATDAPFLATRLGVLTHELAGLLDGSMRCLGMARQSIQGPGPAPTGPSVEQQLQTVQAALERMAGLVHAAMQGSGSTIGATASDGERGVTLPEAIEHAMAVTAPMAREHRVEVTSTVAPESAAFEAGPVYAVILNGLRNAIEAIAGAGGGGRVTIDLSRTDAGGFELTITDDGPGLAPACEQGRAFIIGMTTKPGGSGIGLCLSAQIIGQLGGRISLESARAEGERRGAVLTASWPTARTDAGQIG
jgi:signal transduction histidine kinase